MTLLRKQLAKRQFWGQMESQRDWIQKITQQLLAFRLLAAGCGKAPDNDILLSRIAIEQYGEAREQHDEASDSLVASQIPRRREDFMRHRERKHLTGRGFHGY